MLSTRICQDFLSDALRWEDITFRDAQGNFLHGSSVQEAVKEITKSEEQAHQLVNTIMQKRPVTERVYLKKCNKRKPRKKEIT